MDMDDTNTLNSTLFQNNRNVSWIYYWRARED